MGKGEQLDLFSPSNNNSEAIIRISSSAKPLTKEQERFNKISQRIQKLEKQLPVKEQQLNNLLAQYNKQIPPLIEQKLRLYIEIAHILDQKANATNFSKRLIEYVNELVLFLLEEAFTEIEPNEVDIALYDKYSEYSFKEMQEQEMNKMKAYFNDFVKERFNVDIDLTDVNMEDPAERARIMSELQDEMRKNETNEIPESSRAKERKKTKKQLEKELQEKHRVELQSKSIKSIYISLSKALHPDTETDVEMKMEKEELMKKVTVAYQEKNFPLLLQLEAEWVNKTEQSINQLSDDKLKIYNSILHERENELKEELYMLEHNPKFRFIHRFVHMHPSSALKALIYEAEKFKFDLQLIEENKVNIQGLTKKGELTEYISDMYNHLIADDDDFDLSMLLNYL